MRLPRYICHPTPLNPSQTESGTEERKMKMTIVKQKIQPSFFFQVNGTVPTPKVTCVVLTHLPTHLHSGIKISILSTHYIEICNSHAIWHGYEKLQSEKVSLGKICNQMLNIIIIISIMPTIHHKMREVKSMKITS